MRRSLGVILAVLILISPGVRSLGETPKVFRAGASAVDVSPKVLPALVNGGFLEARSDKVRDPLIARALVLDDGTTRLAIVVLDSCMMPRDLLDRAKTLARDRTGIPTDRILVSATHTHSAPAAMGALGCAPDLNYVELLPTKDRGEYRAGDGRPAAGAGSGGGRSTTSSTPIAGAGFDGRTG